MKLEDIKPDLVWKVMQRCTTMHYKFFKADSIILPDYDSTAKVSCEYDRGTFTSTFLIRINGLMYSIKLIALIKKLNAYFNCGFDVGDYHVQINDLTSAADKIKKMFTTVIDSAE